MALMAGGLLAMSALGSAPLQAVVLASNITNSTAGGVSFLDNQWFAGSFTTNGTVWTLNSVTINIFGVGNADPGFSVNIYSDGEGFPGTFQTTLSGPSSPTVGNNTYTGSFALAPNTTYFLMGQVSAGSAGDYRWPVTLDLSETGEAGASIGDSRLQSNNDGVSWPTSAVFPLQFEVNVTAGGEVVPFHTDVLPGLLAATSLLGWDIRRRARAKKSKAALQS